MGREEEHRWASRCSPTIRKSFPENWREGKLGGF